MNRIYLCIDLKSFYASVECVERGLDPMTARLVVADPARERGTICLAVSPALKALGIHNRCRVFEIPQGIQYIMAPPRMKLYIDYSANIYAIYLKYLSKEDIHVYSIDEAFLDVTDYLPLYHLDARELALTIMNDIHRQLGVVATCGIGTNLYLAKVALDITAKHVADNISFLDETRYRKTLWNHRPITDFWRVGHGIAKRLASMGIFTMEGITLAREDLLYRAFGVDAEYLIDHAWGRESTTIADIKAYKSKNNSLSNGQVLFRDYSFEEGLLIVKEMVDLLCLDMVDRHLVTNSIHLHVGYSKHVIPSVNASSQMSVTTNSAPIITDYFVTLYRRTVNAAAPIRRITITVNNVVDEAFEQYDLFTRPEDLERSRQISHAVLDIKRRFGKNALLKGMNLQQAATTMERNRQIGGHRSGDE